MTDTYKDVNAVSARTKLEAAKAVIEAAMQAASIAEVETALEEAEELAKKTALEAKAKWEAAEKSLADARAKVAAEKAASEKAALEKAALEKSASAKEEASVKAAKKQLETSKPIQNDGQNNGNAVVRYSITALTMGLGAAGVGWKVATEATKSGRQFAINHPILANINTAIFRIGAKLAKPNTKFYTFYIGPKGRASSEMLANRLKTNAALFGAGVGILSSVAVGLFVPQVVMAAAAYNLVVLPASYGLLQVAATSGTALTSGIIAAEATAIAVRLYNNPTEIIDVMIYNKLWCFMNIAGGIVLGAKAAGYTHNLGLMNAKIIGGLAGTISCLAGGQDTQPHANKIAPEAPETMVDAVISGAKTAFNIATSLACGVAVCEYAYPMVAGAAHNIFARNNIEDRVARNHEGEFDFGKTDAQKGVAGADHKYGEVY